MAFMKRQLSELIFNSLRGALYDKVFRRLRTAGFLNDSVRLQKKRKCVILYQYD